MKGMRNHQTVTLYAFHFQLVQESINCRTLTRNHDVSGTVDACDRHLGSFGCNRRGRDIAPLFTLVPVSLGWPVAGTNAVAVAMSFSTGARALLPFFGVPFAIP